MASGSVARPEHPVRAEPLLGPHRQCVDVQARGEPLWVTTTWSKHRLERREDAVDVLVGHHRDHADQVTGSELVGQRVGQAAAPAGLCAASTNTVGALRIALQPTGGGHRGEPARTAAMSS